MSGGIEISSGRKPKTGAVVVSSPLDRLAKIPYFQKVIAEIESDLAETDTRRDLIHGNRDYIPVFIDLSPQAKDIIKALYERAGWVVDCDENGVIDFYFHK